VVPVDEDMTRCREDVEGTTLQERNGFYELWRREKERQNFRRLPVLSVSMVKTSSVKENMGRS